MEIKGIVSELKDVDVTKRTACGYLAHFGTKDADGDIIMPGAFSKTIAERGPNGSRLIKHLLDHNKTQVVGVFTELKEDNTGLYYESKIGTHKLGRDFLDMCESGIINQHSIGYKRIRQDKKSDGTYLKEVMLGEGSSIQFLASNSNTPLLGLKSDPEILEYMQNLEKAIKNGSFSDEAMLVLIDYSKSIQKSLTEKHAPDFSTHEESAPIDLKQLIINAFSTN